MRCVVLARQPLRKLARAAVALAPGSPERAANEPEDDRRHDPAVPVAVLRFVHEPESEDEGEEQTDHDRDDGEARQPEQDSDLARPLPLQRRQVEHAGDDRASDQQERARDVEKEQGVVRAHSRRAYSSDRPTYNRRIDASERHLRLLTETIEAVNSTLDLEEVLAIVARKVAEALGADACFVYLYDERADELVLRATHGTRVEEMTGRPRMRPGDGITGSAAATRAPVMIAAQAHLDERFKAFPNLPEDEYESILAVPILAREKLAGALNVRTRLPREFSGPEIELLLAIAAQVAQTIEHAKLYAEAQRRVGELEALARISEAVSESLYLEESLEAIVKTTIDAVGASGAALVLEDGNVAWPEGRPGGHAVRLPLRWKRRQIGELVCDRDTPFTDEERALLGSIAHHAAVALEHGRAVMRGVLAQEIHHRVKNNLQTVASLLRLQARAAGGVDPQKALDDSVNRILAIAAVHEVLTEQRDEEIELAELLDRLRAMLVQGLGAEKDVRAQLEQVSLAGNRATALALVFSELFQNALEHGGQSVRVELARRNGEVMLAIADNGEGLAGGDGGTGLSIVRALVRDELGGSFDLRHDDGTRAEVVFPA